MKRITLTLVCVIGLMAGHAILQANTLANAMFLPMILRLEPSPTPTPRPTNRPTPTVLSPISTPTRTPRPTATNTPIPSGVCPCSGDMLNCGDFSTQSSAQACHDYCVAQGRGDIHRLDGDNDGEACESLP